MNTFTGGTMGCNLIVYGCPTAGKSSAIDKMKKEGYPCVDTDDLIQLICLTHSNGRTDPWLFWASKDRDFKKTVEQEILKYVKTLLAIVFTNFSSCEFDIGYTRYVYDIRDKMELCNPRGFRLNKDQPWLTFSKKDEYLKHPVGKPIILNPNEFIDTSDIIRCYEMKIKEVLK